MKYIVLFLMFPFLAFAQNQKPASPAGKGAIPIESKAVNSSSKNTYAVVVGISDYQEPRIPDLRLADIEQWSTLMKKYFPDQHKE